MMSALEGGTGVVEKWTRVLISCVIMYVTRGEGVKKFEIFMDVIDRSPLTVSINQLFIINSDFEIYCCTTKICYINGGALEFMKDCTGVSLFQRANATTRHRRATTKAVVATAPQRESSETTAKSVTKSITTTATRWRSPASVSWSILKSLGTSHIWIRDISILVPKELWFWFIGSFDQFIWNGNLKRHHFPIHNSLFHKQAKTIAIHDSWLRNQHSSNLNDNLACRRPGHRLPVHL